MGREDETFARDRMAHLRRTMADRTRLDAGLQEWVFRTGYGRQEQSQPLGRDPLGRPVFTAQDSTGGGYVNGVYRNKDQYEQAQMFAEGYENYRQKDPKVTFSGYLDEAAQKISEFTSGTNDFSPVSARQARSKLRNILGS